MDPSHSPASRRNHPTARDRLAAWHSRARPRRMSGLPPGPSWIPTPIQTLGLWTMRPTTLRHMQRRYGDVFTLSDLPVGKVVVLCAAADVRMVLRGHPDLFLGGDGNSALGPVVGARSVITLDGHDHRSQRKPMVPAFHGGRIRMTTSMEELTKREISRWPVDTSFALLTSMQDLSLRIIVRTIIGEDDPVEADKLALALRAAIPHRVVDLAVWQLSSLAGIGPWRKLLNAMDHADGLLYRHIERRRADPLRESRGDVLSMLFDGNRDDETIRDGLMSLLVAGHETTAVELAWIFEELLRDQHSLDRVLAGLDRDDDPYRAAVIKEALRLHPAIFNVMRRITGELELSNGQRLRAGTLIMPSIGSAHTDARIWGSDADRFRPARWFDPEVPEAAWFPFGGGARRCLGSSFALAEIDVVIRTILRSTRLVPDRRAHERQRMHHATVVPHRGTRVRLESRL
ncbi:cytochrome P450 [Nocardia nepalensis]|uniref:cytochrome P450 n=1 Tax=Nocardia nepalensis TaxID=3375448 RepID=UPI003B66C707